MLYHAAGSREQCQAFHGQRSKAVLCQAAGSGELECDELLACRRTLVAYTTSITARCSWGIYATQLVSFCVQTHSKAPLMQLKDKSQSQSNS